MIYKVVFVSLLIIAGCSRAPVQEMSDARQAIKAAEAAGANTKSPTVLSEAQKHLYSAKTALHKGQYQRARSSALRAKMQAIKAHKLSVNYQIIY